jgi:hypothetical protein
MMQQAVYVVVGYFSEGKAKQEVRGYSWSDGRVGVIVRRVLLASGYKSS